MASAELSPLRAFWAAFRENRGAFAGFVVVVLIVLLAVFADLVAPHSPTEQFRDAVRAVPMWAEGGTSRFVLGTDSLGRDMLSRLIHGARVSLFIGLAVMGVSNEHHDVTIPSLVGRLGEPEPAARCRMTVLSRVMRLANRYETDTFRI